MERMFERVQNTKKALRKYEIEGTFREFNKHILHLTIDQRIEKYKKMVESPYQYFLGSSSLFYYDMSKIPFAFPSLDQYGWIHGNLHFESFTFFKDEEGKIIFSINDFKDATKGSYLNDLLRMAVSIALKSESQNYTKKEQKENICKYLKGYYNQLKKFKKGKADPILVSFTNENTDGPIKEVLNQLEINGEDSLSKITHITVGNKRIFNYSKEIASATDEEKIKIKAVLEKFFSLYGEDIEIKDIARKIDNDVTKTSFDSFVILINQNLKDLVLELNEVRTSIPSYFTHNSELFFEKYDKQGKRVVEMERSFHYLDDTYLSYFTIDGKHFYLRKYCQLKTDFELANLKDFQETVKLMGAVTAKLHSCNCEHYNCAAEIYKAIDEDFDEFCNQITTTAFHLKERIIEDFPVFCEWVEGKYFDKRRVALDKVVSGVAVLFDKLTEASNGKYSNNENIQSDQKQQSDFVNAELQSSVNEISNEANKNEIKEQEKLATEEDVKELSEEVNQIEIAEESFEIMDQVEHKHDSNDVDGEEDITEEVSEESNVKTEDVVEVDEGQVLAESVEIVEENVNTLTKEMEVKEVIEESVVDENNEVDENSLRTEDTTIEVETVNQNELAIELQAEVAAEIEINEEETLQDENHENSDSISSIENSNKKIQSLYEIVEQLNKQFSATKVNQREKE